MSRRHKKSSPQAPPASAPTPNLGSGRWHRLKASWAGRPRWFRAFVLGGTALGVLLGCWLIWGPSTPVLVEKDYPIPPYSPSRFLNVGSEAHYVGAKACIECHGSKHQSYLLTAHSRAFAEVDPGAEPPDGSFTQERTGRTYRVYRRDGKLRHEEVIRSEDGKEVARMDLPIRYRIGSGDFARTYAVEVDGFLHESPITWYASKKKWGMSPGYDTPAHLSFERPISANCLVCHTGQVQAGAAVHRPLLHEQVIGCESCHGPGSRHVELRKANKTPAEDWTIVNPAKLSRAHLESVCASCHLMGPARVYLRGRQTGDFRPGMALDDYCIDYRLDRGNEAMTVVGHMEQLRRSACYQKAKDLSCLTCHDLHARERPKDPIEYHRQKCLTCHTTSPCKIEEPRRRKQSPADNCAACHMPRGDTDIPHVAFTHHRIGIHGAKRAPDLELVPELIPTSDVSSLAPLDQRRNLGLAYLQAARQPELARHKGAFADRARALLKDVQKEGLREAETDGALADLYLTTDPARSQWYAQRALQAKNSAAEVRASALILLAAIEMRKKDGPSALERLKELTSLRRSSEDWALLGVCHRILNEPREAQTALEHALSIRSDLPAIHLQLADVQRRLGNDRSAKEHEDMARSMQRR